MHHGDTESAEEDGKLAWSWGFNGLVRDLSVSVVELLIEGRDG
jgi:hypothetical protein